MTSELSPLGSTTNGYCLGDEVDNTQTETDIVTSFEYTLNIANINKFVNKPSWSQKRCLKIALSQAITKVNRAYKLSIDKKTRYAFELTKNKVIHMHVNLYLKHSSLTDIGMIVNDLSKAQHQIINTTYNRNTNNYNDMKYYPEWKRFKSPMVVMQPCTEARHEIWTTYINKAPV